MTPDYLARLGAAIVREEARVRIRYKGHNAVFPGLEPDELRQRFDEGMRNAVAHYTANVRAAGVHYAEHKDQPLVVGRRELDSPASHDECWGFCTREFGERYRELAAAMTGMSVEAFAKYEKRRTEFFNR